MKIPSLPTLHPNNAASVRGLLPPRQPSAHKGTHGSVAIVGGAQGMVGAALLAARAALYAGAGKVFVYSIDDALPSVDPLHPELMIRPYASLDDILPHLSALVLGCGLGQAQHASIALKQGLDFSGPIVLDADALNLLAASPELQERLRQRTHPCVLTPHPAEAARLLNWSTDDVQSQRYQAALTIAQQLNSLCVLKGHQSVIVTPEGEAWLNDSGNAGLATAGTGDVLSGTLGSLMAQGLSAVSAARLGVYAHGAAAEQLHAQGQGLVGMTASEIVTALRSVLNATIEHR